MTAKTKIEEAMKLLGQALAELDVPAPDPEPEPARLVRVDVARTNAWCVAKTNESGRFVMKIYPESESAVRDRIQFNNGVTVRVHNKIVKTDGGDKFYWIVDPVWKNNVLVPVDLYLRADHVTLV
jgi:hypothetical protein